MIDFLRNWDYNMFVRSTAYGRAGYNPDTEKRNNIAYRKIAGRIKIAPGCAVSLPAFNLIRIDYWTAIGNGTAKGNFALKGRVL